MASTLSADPLTTRVYIEGGGTNAETARRLVTSAGASGNIAADGRAGLHTFYLANGFGAHELDVPVETPPHRGRSERPARRPGPIHRDDAIEVDWWARQVRVDGRSVALTPLEFRLLEAFVRHPGQALSTEQLLDLVWGDPFGIGPERVKFTVLRLRRKLGWQDGVKRPLETVRGYGYRYVSSP